MRRNRNRMSSDASLVLVLTMLLCGFCVEKASMESDDGTSRSELSDVFSIFNTPTMTEPSNPTVAPGSSTAKPPKTQVPPNSTIAELSSTQVTPSSTIPGLLLTTMTPIDTNSEHPNTQVTPSQTTAAVFNNRSSEAELEQTTASSLDAEDATAAGSASGIPWENSNVTDDTLTTTTAVSATGLSPRMTHSNDSYDVSVDNETTLFPFMDNATDYKNDTNMTSTDDKNATNMTSTDDSDQLGNTMTSLMTQPSEANTTTKPAVNISTSKAPEPSSSSMSSFPSSQSSLSFSEDTTPSLHQSPSPQPQEMTVTSKVALGFGVIVGISCVIIVATVTVRQCLGYWARRDYSNLDQDNISFS